MTTHRIVLASTSPRRRELLQSTGIAFDVIAPHASAESEDEQLQPNESPAEFVERLAYQKAADVVEQIASAHPFAKPNSSPLAVDIDGDLDGDRLKACPTLVVGCDTVAEIDGMILGKPKDRDEAKRILELLSGRRHRVWSGLCVMDVSTRQRWLGRAESQLDMKPLSEWELDTYLDSGDWRGKSGAFGYQDGHPWLKLISGSADNVVGLPLDLLRTILRNRSRDEQAFYWKPDA